MSLLADIRASAPRFVELTRKLVERETPTLEVAACELLADDLAAWAREQGAQVEVRTAEERGPHVIARWDGGGGASTLALMHYDTVWPIGTLVERPFTVDGDVVRGPGTLDMKGGIAVFQLAIEQVRAHGTELAGPLTAVFTSDEENGSLTSRALIEDLARSVDRTYCFEPGADPFRLRMERKGVGRYVVSFQGVASHAGNAPEKGASALLEASRFALETVPLNDPEAGVSLVAGVMHAGTVVNVVPAEATMELDLRVWNASEADAIDASLRGYVPRDPRVSFEVQGGMNRPPLEKTVANDALFELAFAAAADIGRDLGRAAVGGGSDGSFASSVGCATLDGMGACGDGPHTVGEHIRITDSVDKAAILARLLTTP